MPSDLEAAISLRESFQFWLYSAGTAESLNQNQIFCIFMFGPPGVIETPYRHCPTINDHGCWGTVEQKIQLSRRRLGSGSVDASRSASPCQTSLASRRKKGIETRALTRSAGGTPRATTVPLDRGSFRLVGWNLSHSQTSRRTNPKAVSYPPSPSRRGLLKHSFGNSHNTGIRRPARKYTTY
jgi:hypothetical protein